VALRHLADDGEPEPGARHGPGRGGPVEAVEDLGQVGGLDAGPAVAHGELAVPQPDLHPAARRAELGRVIQQVPDRDAQPVGLAADDTGLEIRGEGGPRPVPAGTVQAGGDHVVQRHVADLASLRLPAGQLGDAGDQLAELGHLGDDPVQHLLAFGLRHGRGRRQQLAVDPQAGHRGAQLVAGVADQLPLGGQRALQRLEHGVERGGEPSYFVGAFHFDPAGRVPGLRHPFGQCGQAGHRREPGPGHRPASQRRQRDPDEAEQGQRRPDAGHLPLDRVERHRHLGGQAGHERRGEHHGVHPVELVLRVVGAAPAGRDLGRGGVTGQHPGVADRRAGRRPDSPLGRHHLGVGAGHAEAIRVRRHPAGRDVAVEVAGHPVHHCRLLLQLAVHLVLQVGADHDEGHGRDAQRHRGDRGGHGDGETGPQHERPPAPGPPPDHGTARMT
jgi:hypothetical protein